MIERCDIQHECDCGNDECRVQGVFRYKKTPAPFIEFKPWEIALVAFLLASAMCIASVSADAYYERVEIERAV